MSARTASCRCGQLRVECAGDPVRISVCHCLECKRRSGSAFAAQARWPEGKVRIEGQSTAWTHVGESGSPAHFHFCPVCGGHVFYRAEAMPDLIAVTIGSFADPAFPGPEYSVYEKRKLPWVEITGAGVDHYD